MACRKCRSVGCGYPVFCTACLLWKQDAEALAAQYEHIESRRGCRHGRTNEAHGEASIAVG